MKKNFFNLISQELNDLADSEKSAILSRFFKTAPGQYGAGDVFLGITVPQQRTVARRYQKADRRAIGRLLASPIHEYRLTGLIILVRQYEAAQETERKNIADFYFTKRRAANNWDLVDVTAPKILGHFWFHYCSAAQRLLVLRHLAESDNLWDGRIAMVSTLYFISQGRTKETYWLADKLLTDKHNLIHKAVGWMLREAGKQVSVIELKKFLNIRAAKMPRIALRYAIERLSEVERRAYLQIK